MICPILRQTPHGVWLPFNQIPDALRPLATCCQSSPTRPSTRHQSDLGLTCILAHRPRHTRHSSPKQSRAHSSSRPSRRPQLVSRIRRARLRSSMSGSISLAVHFLPRHPLSPPSPIAALCTFVQADQQCLRSATSTRRKPETLHGASPSDGTSPFDCLVLRPIISPSPPPPSSDTSWRLIKD